MLFNTKDLNTLCSTCISEKALCEVP